MLKGCFRFLMSFYTKAETQKKCSKVKRHALYKAYITFSCISHFVESIY